MTRRLSNYKRDQLVQKKLLIGAWIEEDKVRLADPVCADALPFLKRIAQHNEYLLQKINAILGDPNG